MGTAGIRDLALAAAFTSTSLRERCIELAGVDVRELTDFADRGNYNVTLNMNRNQNAFIFLIFSLKQEIDTHFCLNCSRQVFLQMPVDYKRQVKRNDRDIKSNSEKERESEGGTL